MGQMPSRINPKKCTPRHIIMKLLKTEDRKILKTTREKQHLVCKGARIQMMVCLLGQ